GNQALPQTLDQLQSFINANPKRFGYNDPNNGGAGEAFIQRIVTITGGDFNSKTDSIDPTVVKRWQKGWLWFAANRDNITLTASGA
ncbi:LysR family transcriptional regulator, partial [Klebsiella pneumoniae]|nr:LysR family transcriptional regulator [Klebsiella pneumoniae]